MSNQENNNGMSVGVSGIPLAPDETGNIPSPFPYLNPDSREWGDDEQDGGGGITALRKPHDPDDFGGNEVDEDEYEETDDDEDNDRGLGFGVGMFLTTFNMPMPA